MAKGRLPVFETSFGKYSATEIKGEGGAGRVYAVTDESGDPFAIKVLDPAQAGGGKLKRFKNEILFCLRNQHKNIVTVVDHGVYLDADVSCPFYVMPLFDASLRTLLKEGIAPERALPYFSQLLDGVEAAHLKNVVHRDLKPENILVDRKEGRLVIADFGIAQFREDELWTAVETRAADRLANFQYAAPEQRTRGREVDHRADIYALGLILNEMFTGQVIQGTGCKTIASVSPDNAFLDDLVDEMIRQAPEERPASIDAAKKALIGRKNHFVTRQRLSQLKDAVIPVADIDDPLVLDPPRLVDVDWERGLLTLTLSRPVNETWIRVLQNDVGGPFVYGYRAENFRFAGNRAMIKAGENVAGQVVEHFKAWLPQANNAYERLVREEKDEDQRQARRAAEAEIEEQERRARVLRNIHI